MPGVVEPDRLQWKLTDAHVAIYRPLTTSQWMPEVGDHGTDRPRSHSGRPEQLQDEPTTLREYVDTDDPVHLLTSREGNRVFGSPLRA